MAFATYNESKVMEILSKNNERSLFFKNMGVTLDNAHSLETAMKVSGLDFKAEKWPASETVRIGENMFTSKLCDDQSFMEVHRTDNGQLLGRVKDKYKILQNEEAFGFMDSLLGAGAKFTTAGFYGRNGAKTFMTAETEPLTILGDEFKPYLLMSNGFDGGSGVRIAFTNVRVFCSNCLVRAFKNASNVVTVQHSKLMMSKLEEAKYILLNQTKYLEALKAEAEKLATTPFSAEAFEALIREHFNQTDEKGEVTLKNAVMIEAMLRAYKQNDLENFSNTAYRAVQAVADVNSHMPTMRKTKNIDNNFMIVMNGMELFNTLTNKIIEKAGN